LAHHALALQAAFERLGGDDRAGSRNVLDAVLALQA
jgi:hypothetical protein